MGLGGVCGRALGVLVCVRVWTGARRGVDACERCRRGQVVMGQWALSYARESVWYGKSVRMCELLVNG